MSMGPRVESLCEISSEAVTAFSCRGLVQLERCRHICMRLGPRRNDVLGLLCSLTLDSDREVGFRVCENSAGARARTRLEQARGGVYTRGPARGWCWYRAYAKARRCNLQNLRQKLTKKGYLDARTWRIARCMVCRGNTTT